MTWNNNSSNFIKLLTGSQGRLYGYILSLVYDPDHASDLLQQTNMILWQKKNDFEAGTNFIAWAFRVAYFQVLAFRKQNHRSKLAFDDELLVSVAETAVIQDETFEMRQQLLQQCMQKIRPRQRDVVRSRYSEGSSLSRIAVEMDMTENGVKQLLFRARNALMKCVEESLGKERLE